MKIRALTSNICLICSKDCKRPNRLGMHISSEHNMTSTQYTIECIFQNNLPTCKCGCGIPVTVYKYDYQDYHVGHSPNCHWQTKYEKDSDDFKLRSEMVSNSLKKYYEENPKIVDDEFGRRWQVAQTRCYELYPERKQSAINKMTETKRKQSAHGLLSGENNFYSKLTLEERIEIQKKKRETYESKSEEEKLERSIKRSNLSKEIWSSLTPEERAIWCENIKNGINNMPAEVKERKFTNHSRNMKETMSRMNGNQSLRPLYNKETIPYIADILNVRYNTEFIHAESESGEYRIHDPELNKIYFADAYCPNLNLWVEFDEPNKFTLGELKQPHIDRQNRIEQILNCDVIRIYFDKSLHCHYE